jgi:hypothetical protein
MDKIKLDIFIKELEDLCKANNAWHNITREMKPDLKTVRVEISVKIK